MIFSSVSCKTGLISSITMKLNAGLISQCLANNGKPQQLRTSDSTTVRAIYYSLKNIRMRWDYQQIQENLP